MFQAGPRQRASGKRHVKTESVLFIRKTLAFAEAPHCKIPVTSSRADADRASLASCKGLWGRWVFNRVHCHPNKIGLLLVKKKMNMDMEMEATGLACYNHALNRCCRVACPYNVPNYTVTSWKVWAVCTCVSSLHRASLSIPKYESQIRNQCWLFLSETYQLPMPRYKNLTCIVIRLYVL